MSLANQWVIESYPKAKFAGGSKLLRNAGCLQPVGVRVGQRLGPATIVTENSSRYGSRISDLVKAKPEGRAMKRMR